jgi:acetyl esterase/lipase
VVNEGADQLNIRLDRIVIGGVSAGGNVSAYSLWRVSDLKSGQLAAALAMRICSSASPLPKPVLVVLSAPLLTFESTGHENDPRSHYFAVPDASVAAVRDRSTRRWAQSPSRFETTTCPTRA